MTVLWLQKIASKSIYPKISLFMWKLLHNEIPTDQALCLKKKCLCIISKSLYCPSAPNIEYNNHLFLSSETVATIRCFFTTLMNIRGECCTTNHILVKWRQLLKGDNLCAWLLKMLHGIILWNWKSKNKARFGECDMHCTSSIYNVRSNIVDLCTAHKLTLSKGNTLVECLFFYNHDTIEIKFTLQLIKWIPPTGAWVKLNSDGASKGNPWESATGGILQDCNSKFLGALAEYLGIQTSMSAEANAIWLGLSLAKSLGCRLLWIEADSLLLVNILNDLVDVPWSISYIVLDTKNAIMNFEACRITHINMEENGFADMMANWGLPVGPVCNSLMFQSYSKKQRVSSESTKVDCLELEGKKL